MNDDLVIQYHHGDLFEAQTSAIAHGVNMRGRPDLDAGVAAIMWRKWPAVASNYRMAFIRSRLHPGMAQRVAVGIPSPGSMTPRRYRAVYNLVTQIEPGPDAQPSLILAAFRDMMLQASYHGDFSVAIPRIGTGIGDLTWDGDVLPAIKLAAESIHAMPEHLLKPHRHHGSRVMLPVIAVHDLEPVPGTEYVRLPVISSDADFVS